MNSNARLLLAAVLAVAAALRLILLKRFAKRDRRWLEETFGPSENDQTIAESHSMFWAVGFAGAALLVLYV